MKNKTKKIIAGGLIAGATLAGVLAVDNLKEKSFEKTSKKIFRKQ